MPGELNVTSELRNEVVNWLHIDLKGRTLTLFTGETREEAGLRVVQFHLDPSMRSFQVHNDGLMMSAEMTQAEWEKRNRERSAAECLVRYPSSLGAVFLLDEQGPTSVDEVLEVFSGANGHVVMQDMINAGIIELGEGTLALSSTGQQYVSRFRELLDTRESA